MRLRIESRFHGPGNAVVDDATLQDYSALPPAGEQDCATFLLDTGTGCVDILGATGASYVTG